jgi:hypothetical protein
MDRQTQLLEQLARRPDKGNEQGKMVAFMRLHPPTFDSAEEDPLLADDWLRTMAKKLNAVKAMEEEKVSLATHQLVGAAGEWWENYQDAVQDADVITWQEFIDAFRDYHIPDGIMEIKEEFRNLRQGTMTINQYIWKFTKLARYAPNDINSDRKKQRKFIKGLQPALREQIIAHIYPYFNTLMNQTILLEEAKNRTEGEKKHKFLMLWGRQQERTQRSHISTLASYQPTM